MKKIFYIALSVILIVLTLASCASGRKFTYNEFSIRLPSDTQALTSDDFDVVYKTTRGVNVYVVSTTYAELTQAGFTDLSMDAAVFAEANLKALSGAEAISSVYTLSRDIAYYSYTIQDYYWTMAVCKS